MKILKLTLIIFLLSVSFQSLSRAQTFNTFASVYKPSGLAFSPGGFLFVSSQDSNKIYKISPAGVVTIYVSTGLSSPEELVFAPDGTGDLIVADFVSNTIKKIPPTQLASTFASGFHGPFGIAADSSGNYYVTNFDNNTVSKVTSTGTVTTFATGFNNPVGLTYSGGNLYVANRGTNSILKVTVPGGVVTTFATGLNQPQCVEYAVNTGYMFVANYANETGTTVSRITHGGTVQPYASGFSVPVDVAFDASRFMYVANFGNSTIYKSTTATGINLSTSEIPEKFSLEQNYPNPFNPTTHIKFSIPKPGLVRLEIYDVLGKETVKLVDEQLRTGNYEVTFDGLNLPSGAYFYKLITSDFVDTKSMILVK